MKSQSTNQLGERDLDRERSLCLSFDRRSVGERDRTMPGGSHLARVEECARMRGRHVAWHGQVRGVRVAPFVAGLRVPRDEA